MKKHKRRNRRRYPEEPRVVKVRGQFVIRYGRSTYLGRDGFVSHFARHATPWKFLAAARARLEKENEKVNEKPLTSL